MPEIETINHVCVSCQEANLLTEIKVSRCTSCNKLYCLHFASNIDPAQCIECLSNVTMLKEVVTKTYEHYNEETDVVTVYKRRAKSIRLEGMDWLFAQRKIKDMSDDSLELAIEYHRQLLFNGLIAEREARRVKYAHRNAGLPLPAMSPAKDSATEAVTTTKVTKQIKSTKNAAAANGLLQSMLAQGLNMTQIMALLSAVKK
jgi:hypothetical protein